jgi:hypothetical protein
MFNEKSVVQFHKKYPDKAAAAYYKKTLANRIKHLKEMHSDREWLSKMLGISYAKLMRCLSASDRDWFSPRHAKALDLLTENTEFYISKCAIRPDVFAPTSGRKN